MDLFQYDSYKKWVTHRIESLPNKGRGQYRRLAERLRTNSTIIHQIFKGDRDLTPEQALLLAEYFGLTQAEQKFFLLLVNYSRAASAKYQGVLKEEIQEARKASQEIKNRVAQDFRLTDEAKAVVYSNWYYLAIWSLVAIQGFQTAEPIAARLSLPREIVQNAVEKLIKHGLLVVIHGVLAIGPALLHLEASSPHISRHHQNWRLQAFRRYENPPAKDLFYTAPITLSEQTAEKIRQNILKMIGDMTTAVKDSPSEKLYCLCLDWFEL
jgi:plasmid maintenance system antidote protein VapI